jgi:predicted nucleotidyltransferase
MQAIESIKDILTKNKPYLFSKYSLSSIGIFGTVLTDAFENEHAVEIIVDFKKPIGIEIIDLEDELSKLLQYKVDLVTKNGIEKSYYNMFRKEIQYI